MEPITVKELIEHLKQYPEDMLVGHANSVDVVSTVWVSKQRVTRVGPFAQFTLGLEYLDISK